MKNIYNKGNTGPLIASIIIILVLLVSGIYAMKERPLKVETPVVDSEIEALSTQGTSTEIYDIEKDLNETNLNDLNSDINSVDSEL
ncbi:MAG: hypothetical protein WCO84_03080 [bacterium]